MKPPPPGPATNGTVTPNALAVATAASTALPPCFSTSMPAWLASTSIDATAPPEPTATGCFTTLAGLCPVARAPAGTASSSAATAETAITGKRRMGYLRPARCRSGHRAKLTQTLKTRLDQTPGWVAPRESDDASRLGPLPGRQASLTVTQAIGS